MNVKNPPHPRPISREPAPPKETKETILNWINFYEVTIKKHERSGNKRMAAICTNDLNFWKKKLK